MARVTIDGCSFNGGNIEITGKGEIIIDGVKQGGPPLGRVELHVTGGVTEEPQRPERGFDLEKATADLVAGLNGLTFSAEGDNEEYVRKITPLIRAALRDANEHGRSSRFVPR